MRRFVLSFALLALTSAASAQDDPLFIPDVNKPVGITQLDDGRFLVTQEDGTIVEFRTDGTLSGTFGPTLNDPYGITQLTDGRILAVESGTGSVIAIETTGRGATTFASGLDDPRGITQLADGRILVAEAGAGSVAVFDPDGIPGAAIGSGLTGAYGILERADGRILVAAEYLESQGAGGVAVFAPDGTREDDILGEVEHPRGLLQLADGRLVVSGGGSTGAVSVALADGRGSRIFAELSTPGFMLQLADGRVLVADRTGGSGTTAGALVLLPPPVIFVDASAEGANDGSSWEDAFTGLDDALAIAGSGDQIWMAGGEYRPEGKTFHIQPDASSSGLRRLRVQDGLKIYGGFAGHETSLDHRDLSAGHETFLVGGSPAITAHAFAASPEVGEPREFNLTRETVFDGLTFGRHGASPNNGAFLCQTTSGTCSPTFRNVSFRTFSGTRGYVVRFRHDGDDPGEVFPSFIKSSFESVSENPVALYVIDIDLSLAYENASGGVELVNVTFLNNKAGVATVRVQGDDVTLHVVNSVFANNTGSETGGIWVEGRARPGAVRIVNSTFTGNTNGALRLDYEGPASKGATPSEAAVVTNSILWGNDPAGNGQQIDGDSPLRRYLVTHSILEGIGSGSTAPIDRGEGVLDADPLFSIDENRPAGPAGADGRLGTADDELVLQLGSPAINAGMDTGSLPATDILGVRRTIGLVDMGAYERGGSVALDGAEGYRMLAHPDGGSVHDLLGSTRTTGFGGSDDPDSPFCSVYFYDETAAAFAEGYTCASDSGNQVERGHGLYAYVFADEDPAEPGVQGGFPKAIALTSEPDPSQPFRYGPTITYTEGDSTTDVEQGWNLLGNPYASGFDWDLVMPSGGLSNTVYVYDPNYFGGDYRTWTAGGGGALTDGVVPPIQGFFVKASAPSSTLEIPTAALVDGHPDAYGKGTPAEGEAPDPLRFVLSVEEAGGTREVSAAFVSALEGAALGVDASDAYRLTPGAWPRTVLSTTADGADGPIALAFNAVPLDAEGEIALPVEVAAEGHVAGTLDLSLRWSGALPEGWSAALVDRETGERLAVETGGTYRFTLDVPAASKSAGQRPAGLGLGLAPTAARTERAARTASPGSQASTGERFALVLSPARAVSTDDGAATFAIGLPSPNPARGAATLTATLPEAGAVTLRVFDALGRLVAERRQPAGAGLQRLELPSQGLAAGAYVVRVEAPGGTATRRLTVVR